MSKKLTTADIIMASKEIYGDRWDYSKTTYTNAKTKLVFTCPEHGDFMQRKDHHLAGRVGCGGCSGLRKSGDEFIEEARTLWQDRWDYSKVEYQTSHKQVVILCPTHGKFMQTPAKHLAQQVGCKPCRSEAPNPLTLTPEEFHARMQEIWGDRWDFSPTELGANVKVPVKVVCPRHGEFSQNTEHLLRGQVGCPPCRTVGRSVAEDELEAFVMSLGVAVERGRRDLLGNRQEVDLYVPSRSVAIEFNGVFYHSERFKDASYHRDKFDRAKRQGLRLLQIWEDDWSLRPKAVKEHLSQVLGLSTLPKVSARSTYVREVGFKEAAPFLNEYHIQGAASASTYLGAFFEDTLVALAAFKRSGDDYELVRYATSAQVRGGHSKLVAEFERRFEYKKLVTFADHSFGEGHLYHTTGWTADKTLPPDYSYLVGATRIHKFNYRLKRFRDDPSLEYKEGLSERELARLNGLLRVYDAGKTRFIKPHP